MIFAHFTRTITLATLGAISSLSHGASPEWLTENDAEIKEVINQMTLAEKVGQMTQPDINSIKDLHNIKKLRLGSILSGGSSDPKTGNELHDWANLYSKCQSYALSTRLGIPILYGVDAVHGHNNLIGAVIFPHNIGLGCTRNPELVEKIMRVTAEEVRASGIQWTFAPCLTVPLDIRWGRTYEGFSEDPEIVTSFSAAAVRGLQGDSLSDEGSVVACAKHWVGDGCTTYRTENGGAKLDQGNTEVSQEELLKTHVAPYIPAIDAGVATIMPSYSSWNGIKCSGSKYLLTELLKEELGFEGFLISDYNAIDQLDTSGDAVASVESSNASGQVRTSHYKQCIEISINAGMDMVMVTDHYKDFIRDLTELVEEGLVPMTRIDDAVTRILRVKFAAGMMGPEAKVKPVTKLQADFGSPAHREVARQAVAESLVLLKNTDGLLPLKDQPDRIHVTGRGANDLGMQCGGWTIHWQGFSGSITTGTTLLEGIKAAAAPGTEVSFSSDGSGAEEADVTIVVLGENPYAEMQGDRTDLQLSSEDHAIFEAAQSSGGKVIVVVLSGRPVILGKVLHQADAVVAAWLPGTEGAGVSDVLFGDQPFKGQLSFAWPKSIAGVPSSDPKAEEPLFPLGFGLN